MQKIIFILIFSILLNAKDTYTISYKNMTLGNIKDMRTIKNGYIVAIPSSSWLKFILGFDKYSFYQSNKKPSLNGKVKYTKDKFMILTVIDKLSQNRQSQIIKNGKKILAINCYGYKCKYIRTKVNSSKKYKGHIYYDKNNKLDEICDYESGICIEK